MRRYTDPPETTDPDVLKEVRRLQMKTRNFLLCSPEGQDFLEWILDDLGTFASDPDPTPAQMAYRAYGMRLLEVLGVNHEATLGPLLKKLSELAPVWTASGEKDLEEESADD